MRLHLQADRKSPRRRDLCSLDNADQRTKGLSCNTWCEATIVAISSPAYDVLTRKGYCSFRRGVSSFLY